MPEQTIARALEMLAGLGLLNVWLVRPQMATPFRGGTARTLREEFTAYGLPSAAFYLVGALKVLAGLTFLAALWVPMPARFAAMLVAVLMVGALAMHVRVHDPASRSLPAVVMLAMCAGIALLV